MNLYRIPFHSDVGMLYYRKDWLEQSGYQPLWESLTYEH